MKGAKATIDDSTGMHPLVGREKECRLLDGLLAAVAQRGSALVLRGEPGVGKTALLRYAARMASTRAATARVLQLRGVESESTLPFAALADLVLPLREHLPDLPDAQRVALRVCLALAEGVSTSPYAACAGTLNVLAAAGDRHPLVVLVDDLQWVDPPSQQALLFVARRLAVERVAMVMTVRSDTADLCERSGLPCMEVAGLSTEACGELIREHGYRMAPHVLGDLVRRIAGNPSALLETAASLGEAQLLGQEPLGELPPPGRQLERAWSDRLDGLPERTRQALVVLAASRTTSVGALARAVTAAALTLADLDAAHDAGLVRVAAADGGVGGGDGVDATLEFAHPMLGPFVLRHAALSARMRAYQALAEVSHGDARVWYLAAAAGGPDDGVADALAEVAVRTRRRGGYGASARAWHRSAALTSERATRVDRVLRAAADAHLGGLSQDAAAWADEAARLARGPLVRADVELVRGRVLTWSGHPTRAYDQLVQAAEAVM
ncbi:ATP-binding protein, partial [Frankia sp. CcWB2]